MPKYLFSNDQRISALVERIQWVADYVMSGKNLKDIPGKSDNNNAATLEFYYNLYPNTENTKVAITSPKKVIRNFVLKFQFPNPRTQESFNDTLNEGVFVAPYRTVISILVSLAKIEDRDYSYLTLEEILYYVFAYTNVCKNPSVNYDKLAVQILQERKLGKDFSSYISAKIEWKQYDRQVREMMAVLGKCSECFHLSKGILEYTHNIVDDNFINEVVKYNYFWIPTNKNNFDLSTKEYISYMNMADTPYNIIEFNKENANKIKRNLEIYPLQQIYYGAPGTGKSYEINDLTKPYSTIRTTFHPDSDYSTFVGAYKPVMQKVDLRDLSGHIVEGVQEDRIVYTYVKQAFLKAYLGAWQKYAKGGETAEPQFLVIEEINRGNCAQIFGDLFQLLDRSDNGFSTYPIEADTDLQNEIRKAFAEGGEYAIVNELDVDDAVEGYTSNYGKTLSDDIKSGRVLLLPNNLYIWATMNTSDQSLFPIDSAFKRRWDWRYVKIADAGKGWKIQCGEEYCDWWTFVEKINTLIAKETSSDDKKLGYFFCKPPKDSDTITEDKFVGKVLFYLWNDVFKDGDISLFKVSDEPEAEICFDAFYDSDNKVNVEAIRKFLIGVVGEENIKKKEELEEAKYNDDKIVEDEDGNSATSSRRNLDKFTINDGPECAKNKLAFECIKEYVRQNPDISAQEVYDTWSSLGKLVSHFIETKEEFDARKDDSKQRSQAIECHGTTLYVACDGYGDNGKADLLMNLVNEKDWGLTIKKIVK